MEFGLRHAHDVHTQVFAQLASSSLAAREPARELVADLLASWSQAGQSNGIWSRTGLRPASELDSVMEFGFSRAVSELDEDLRVRVQLATSSRTCM